MILPIQFNPSANVDYLLELSICELAIRWPGSFDRHDIGVKVHDLGGFQLSAMHNQKLGNAFVIAAA